MYRDVETSIKTVNQKMDRIMIEMREEKKMNYTNESQKNNK